MIKRIIYKNNQDSAKTIEPGAARANSSRPDSETLKTAGDCPVKVKNQKAANIAPVFSWNLLGVIAGVLLMGVLFLYFVLWPMEKKLMERDARLAIQGLIGAIGERSSVMDSSTDRYSRDHLISVNKLEKVASIMRSNFEDFLTLEVINEEGRILAMVGDLSEPEPALDSRARVSNYRVLDDGASTGEEVFRDFPEKGYYSVTRRKPVNEGESWYIRGRFSRKSLERAMTQWFPADSVEVDLANITGDVTGLWDQGLEWGKPRIRLKNSFLWGPTRAEAMIFAADWMVTVTKNSERTMFFLGLALILIMIPAAGRLKFKRAAHRFTPAPDRESIADTDYQEANDIPVDITWKGLSAKPGMRFRFNEPGESIGEDYHTGSQSAAPEASTASSDKEAVIEVALEDLSLFAGSLKDDDFNYVTGACDEESGEENTSDNSQFVTEQDHVWAEPDEEDLRDDTVLPAEKSVHAR
jgi:hypothetical protein